MWLLLMDTATVVINVLSICNDVAVALALQCREPCHQAKFRGNNIAYDTTYSRPY